MRPIFQKITLPFIVLLLLAEITWLAHPAQACPLADRGCGHPN